MTFYNKLKWILGILMVFVLIITTNLIDKNNFIRVKDSVVTIYEDRLIAKNLIFEMLKEIQRKEVAVVLSDSTYFNHSNTEVNTNLQSLILRFEQTKLTEEESHVFEDLKNNIDQLIITENQLIVTDFLEKSQVINNITNIKRNLNDLSAIQLNEGSRQMSISKRAIDTMKLFTQIEIFILVFLAIIIQIIVMYQPKDRT